MHVAVIGAGIAGLGTGLGLARAGHEVTILEQDATPMPATAAAAFDWDRRGAPQVRHSHALLARLRNLLRDRYPDVLADLYEAGVNEIRFVELMPETILDRSPQPGDEDLVALAGRRTTFEWVLRRAVLDEPGVELLDGVTVDGLRWSGGGGTATVTGVHGRRGTVASALEVPADLVVAANGRRGGLLAWLAGAGVEVAETEEDTGIVYFSRFYRARPGVEAPPQVGPMAGNLGYLKFGLFLGDAGTFSVTLACHTGDRELRSRLADAAAFSAIAARVPALAPWMAEGVAGPITGVEVMARLVNRRRRFLGPEGEPLVLGLVAVGDAHTCTNPLYGRGCSLAMVQATALVDAVTDAGDDLEAVGRAYEAASAREVLPWYRAAVAQDRMDRAEAGGGGDQPDGGPAADERPAPGPAGALGSDQIKRLLRDGVAPALRVDPVVFRAFLRMFNLLTTPDALMVDPDVLGRVLAVYQDRGGRPAEPVLGPDRSDLLAAPAP